MWQCSQCLRQQIASANFVKGFGRVHPGLTHTSTGRSGCVITRRYPATSGLTQLAVPRCGTAVNTN